MAGGKHLRARSIIPLRAGAQEIAFGIERDRHAIFIHWHIDACLQCKAQMIVHMLACRAQANGTCARLGGLGHPGRVYLGLALLHRYKNSRAGSRMEPLFQLLNATEQRDAEVLGKAMRFGAMFAVSDPTDVAHLVWDPAAKLLELQMNDIGRGLFGEVAQARVSAIGSPA